LLKQNFVNEKNRKKIIGVFNDGDIAGFIIYKQQTNNLGLNKPDLKLDIFIQLWLTCNILNGDLTIIISGFKES
jgi:hypothetical protein